MSQRRFVIGACSNPSNAEQARNGPRFLEAWLHSDWRRWKELALALSRLHSGSRPNNRFVYRLP
jgi:hypothetical protein